MTDRATSESPPREIAIFGGSFNPPHVAHVLATAMVLSLHDLARVLVIPTFQHPFAKTLAPYEDRVKMCELALGWLPGVSVSRVEEELGGESRTLRTLQHLAKTNPAWRMRLIMGADLMVESPKWHAFDEIRALAPPIILGRAGVSYEGAPDVRLPDVSSTEVRALLAEKNWDALADIVPRRALDHIRARGLYARA